MYSPEENGVNALFSGGHPNFYTEDETGRNSEEFSLKYIDLEKDFTTQAGSRQSTCDDQVPTFGKNYKNLLTEH